ncbi:MAG: HAD-IIA family hydrolase [Actinomycetaceae bacterium]|nr:HAD-IIA family hydrolase [Actinomycetaceae bacterium]MDU0969810.1 HAD-IIA family hydrolase [Actinomycetaceae bacterium]
MNAMHEILVEQPLSELPPVEAWLTDMDGVLVQEEEALPGANEFLTALQEHEIPYLVLTNNSIFTPRDLSARLARSGLHVPEERIWTSALATAAFLHQQSPGTSVAVVGEAGLTTALYTAGFTMTTVDPEYVVLGETRSYDFVTITRAIRLIEGGAKFIATNPDVTGPSADGTLPATGAVAAMITAATGRTPYFVGKPNPVMIRAALNRIGAHSEKTVMVGDRMDTDVKAGVEAGLRTHLVLSGSTKREDVNTYPFRPYRVHDGIGDLVGAVSTGIVE